MPEHPASLRSIDEQLARALELVTPLPPVRMPLPAAAGRTLAAPAVARIDLPPFDSAAMDGYAVRAADVADLPATLRVAGDVPAGSGLDPALPLGSAIRIMTGAPVPSEADTVVPFEQTAGGREAGRGALPIDVTVTDARAGAHVRHRGEDGRVGGIVLPAGAALGPRQVAAAVAAGVAEVDVHPAPRVAVISTGSELAAPGAQLTRGRIPESNSGLLAGLVREAGGEPVLVATVSDDAGLLRTALTEARAARVDVVLTTGGVSAGAYEVVRDVLGAQLEFVEVAIRPGRPQASGLLSDGTPVFALPGTPAAAGVVFELFVRPVLLTMQGRAERARPRLRMPVSERHRRRPGRTGFRAVTVDRSDPAGWVARAPDPHGLTDGLAVIPPGAGCVEPGEPVEVVLLG